MSASTPPQRLLNVIRVESPCTADWRAMPGDDRTRFCAHCRLHVNDLSAMTEDEATRLVCESAERPCVRFRPGADGAPVTLDYQKRPSDRRGWRFWTLVGACGALATWAVGCLAESPRRPSAPLMGAISCPRPATGPTAGAGAAAGTGVPATQPAAGVTPVGSDAGPVDPT